MELEFIKKKRKYGLFKDRFKLDIDLFNEGLFVFGSQDSEKKNFLIHLSKEIIKENIRLIYITDSNFVIENLNNGVNDKSVNIENINKVFKNKNYEYNFDINIIKLEQDYSFPMQKKGKQYFPRLLSQLSKLKNTIVIIDEVLNQNIEQTDLVNSIKKLQKSKIGLVVSDYYVRLYDDVLNDIPHHIFFYLYDAPYELKNHPIIVNKTSDVKEFEKRELNYIYDLFSYYNNKDKIIQVDLKI